MLALKLYLDSTLLESVRVVVYLLPFHSSSIVFAEPDDLLQKLGMVAWFCTPVSYTHLGFHQQKQQYLLHLG